MAKVNQAFNSEYARTSAASIRRSGGSAKAAIDKVDTEIKNMKGWWEGDSSDAFEDQFVRLKPNFDKLVVLIDDIAKQLEKIAEIKDSSELDIKSAISRG